MDEKKKGKLVFNSLILPNKLIVVECSECGKQVTEVPYESRSDNKLKKQRIIDNILVCPHCQAVFNERKVICWEKVWSGEWLAKAKNGDFRIWRDGKRGYKWRYRKYGEYPERINFAYTLKEAKDACARHREWIL